MTAPPIERAYPLRWPAGRPRAALRKAALFRHAGRPMTLTSATKRLADQLQAITQRGQKWRTANQVLSTNIRFTLAGTRDQNVSRRDPDDPGVAVYFDLDGRSHVLACDRWGTVQDNIAAIAAHIEALRGQDRWGVADLREAFAGHVALPATPQWSTVLGVPATASADDVRAAYRRLAQSAHPDTGGDRVAWDRLQAAYEQAKKEGQA